MRCASLVIQGEKIARYSQHDSYFLYSVIHAPSRPSSLRPYFLLLLSHYHLVKIFSFLSCSGLSGSLGRYAMLIYLSYSNQVVWVLHSFLLPSREFLFSLSHIYRSPRPVIECSFIIFLRRNSPVLSFVFFLLVSICLLGNPELVSRLYVCYQVQFLKRGKPWEIELHIFCNLLQLCVSLLLLRFPWWQFVVG